MVNIIELLKQVLTEDFCTFILALSLLMIANATTGALKAWKQGEFDIKVLLQGLARYLVWALGAALTVAGAQIYGGDLEIIIGDTQVSLLDAIEIAKKTVYLYWAAKAIANFLEYGQSEKEVKPVDLLGVGTTGSIELENDEEEKG